MKDLFYRNCNAIYFIRAFSLFFTPKRYLRRKLTKELAKLNGYSLSEKEDICDRVNYYNKLTAVTLLPKEASLLKQHTYKDRKHASTYFFDTYEFTRYFSSELHWAHKGGDVTAIPPMPTIVKSRPITYDNKLNNSNSVILKLDRVRHFNFIKDPVPFEKKKNIVLFRGAVYAKPHRQKFLEAYIDQPECNIRDTAPNSTNPQKWRSNPISILEHLKYKYIMALEGHDVASNLKWIMSSNSLAVMPRPTYETWFMEGKLIPNYHYIEIKPDFSDLIERITYYNNHPEEALAIIKHANEYTMQFRNKQREKLISLLVMDKYFKMTGQKI